jgi:hypothetical protein
MAELEVVRALIWQCPSFYTCKSEVLKTGNCSQSISMGMSEHSPLGIPAMGQMDLAYRAQVSCPQAREAPEQPLQCPQGSAGNCCYCPQALPTEQGRLKEASWRREFLGGWICFQTEGWLCMGWDAL